jgi:hypothetical protein
LKTGLAHVWTFKREEKSASISIKSSWRGRLHKMTKKLKVQLTDPQFEVLKSISELSGDTIDEYL